MFFFSFPFGVGWFFVSNHLLQNNNKRISRTEHKKCVRLLVKNANKLVLCRHFIFLAFISGTHQKLLSAWPIKAAGWFVERFKAQLLTHSRHSIYSLNNCRNGPVQWKMLRIQTNMHIYMMWIIINCTKQSIRLCSLVGIVKMKRQVRWW